MMPLVDSIIDVAFECRRGTSLAALFLFGCLSAMLRSGITPAGFCRLSFGQVHCYLHWLQFALGWSPLLLMALPPGRITSKSPSDSIERRHAAAASFETSRR